MTAKIGIVGLGYWGPNLVRNFYGIVGGDNLAVVDRDESRCKHMSTLYPGAKSFNSMENLLVGFNPDAVVIATPAATHFALGKTAIEAGKHVLMEKPFCVTIGEAESLVEMAKGKGLTLMVDHTFLYSAPIAFLKERMESGKIGKPLAISSRRLNLGLFQKDINVVYDLAPHDIAIITYLLGEYPEAVRGSGVAHYAQDIEDVCSLVLEFPKRNLIASLEVSWLHPRKIRELSIAGTDEMIVYDDIETTDKIWIYNKKVTAPSHYDTFAEFSYSYQYGDTFVPAIKLHEPLRKMCSHFIDCFKDKKEPLTGTEHILNVMKILERSNRSIREHGKRIEIL